MKALRRPPRRLLARLVAPVRLNWLRAVRSADGARFLSGGLGMGVFIACLPIFILHIPLAIIVAWILRVSRLATLVGVFVANPLTIVPLYSFTYLIGSMLMPQEAGGPDLLGLIRDPSRFATLGWDDLGRWFLGSSVVGVVLGTVVFEAARRWATRQLALRAARRHTRASALPQPAPIGFHHG